MTSSLGFYIKPKVLESTSFDDDLFANVEEEYEDFDNRGYMDEVPYTSSSIDRSSIGSIPWADDAIKINKSEWEKVEKMLSGLEPLINAEEDLRREILDWQKKFPRLLNKNKYKMKNLSNETLDMESLPSLNLTSEDEQTNEKDTLTRRDISLTARPTNMKVYDTDDLCKSMDNFTIEAVPLKLSQRQANRKCNNRKCTSSSSSVSLRTPPTPVQVPKASAATNRFRMPPILNVLDSRRKFRSLTQNKSHPSFVQLTQVQQAKSAVVAQEQTARSCSYAGHRSAWHVPLAANRFFNNRNSIILPSLPSRQLVIQQSTHSTTNSEVGTSQYTTPSSDSLNPNLLRANLKSFSHVNTKPKRPFLTGSFVTNASTQTNTTSGRSISAAIQYPRSTPFNALYLPYSASKFHIFK